ncbi:tRNA (adenosine(37)-N6)-threonylcarbamoyltransferase complex transferase subunit TsaD [Ligilactobacillus acidipiscis]|uniref:tRNA N6-adenosine threonylcarbamoyltransferase n=1 Tax=Ligilactobacillus acidipiscis TaxID=89059 RepID=A0A0R2JSN2_9LACO|nr:tRNA (adenosine(37)-N6)-threonylcarbamoyltransferase complex transferase subunit TsaD [Ligilactobacillus acidipiscis]KRN77642.1 O-sialoglycoprotein endopeptidase [Ligilactobacillus acidipiscis]SFV40231.1 N(6)-L-threonylcarbamoyladenine synthase TsaD [Ligilactobacillus acidipiscis]
MNEKKDTIILAFESSCDETSVALVRNGAQVLAQSTATQIQSHQRFGGVVPEVASRHHIEQIIGCLDDVFQQTGLGYTDLAAVAVTYGPGLVGALLVGVSAVKAVAFAHNLPLVPVNHMAGHIYAARYTAPIEFPAMALLVSGGHTELVYMPQENDYQIIGETRDDACGEAFDKIGRVLGINYPAGKEIDELAHQGKDTFNFPRAMEKEDNYDFSFSGLKSAFINTVHHADQIGTKLSHDDLAASFEQSVVDVLAEKTVRALHNFPVKQLILAGGVAANSGLRTRLEKECAQIQGVDLLEAPLKYCGDNAAMIGAAGYVGFKHGNRAGMTLNAEPGLEFPWLSV